MINRILLLAEAHAMGLTGKWADRYVAVQIGLTVRKPSKVKKS